MQHYLRLQEWEQSWLAMRGLVGCVDKLDTCAPKGFPAFIGLTRIQRVPHHPV